MIINRKINVLISDILRESIEKLKKYQKETVSLNNLIYSKRSELTILCEEALEEDDNQP